MWLTWSHGHGVIGPKNTHCGRCQASFPGVRNRAFRKKYFHSRLSNGFAVHHHDDDQCV